VTTPYASRLRRGLAGLIVLGSVGLTRKTANSEGGTPAQVERPLLADSGVPGPVRSVLRWACQDCHSANTVWPWYAHVPPVSFQIHDDVARARGFVDFSKWNEYSEGQRRGFTMAIGAAVGSGLMPPPQYLWIHPGAHLSGSELALLQAWALETSKTKPPI
jgi:hypothetical protein